MAKMPVLFIGHGSPMNIILDNEYTRSLARLGALLPRPKMIAVISAHWLTQGTAVTAAEKPRIIYDFYGFPKALYDISYPCPGGIASSLQLSEVINKEKLKLDDQWGIDHGAWAVLKHMYPAADIPVVEISLDQTKSGKFHYELGKKLISLREEGVLVIGSGNIVHNLYQANFENLDAKPYSWAVEYDQAVKRCLLEQNHEALIEYEKLTPSAALAVPTNEHYLPLLYTLALQKAEDKISFIYEGMQNASISMRCIYIGEDADNFYK